MKTSAIALIIVLSIVSPAMSQVSALSINTASQINVPAMTALGSFNTASTFQVQPTQQQVAFGQMQEIGRAMSENRYADVARHFQANPPGSMGSMSADPYGMSFVFKTYRDKTTEMLDRVLNRIQSEQGNSGGEFAELWAARGIFKNSTFGRALPFDEVQFVQALQNLDGNAPQLQRNLDKQNYNETAKLLYNCVRDYSIVFTSLTKLHRASDQPGGTVILGHTFRFARPLYFALLERCRAILKNVKTSKDKELLSKFIKLRDKFRTMRHQLIEVRNIERSGSSTATTHGSRAEKAIKSLKEVFELTKSFGSIVDELDMPKI